MALSASVLFGDYLYEAGVTSYATGSLDLSAGVHVAVMFCNALTGTPSLSGGRGTWTQRHTREMSLDTWEVYVWEGSGSITDEAVTLTITGGSCFVPHLYVVEITGTSPTFVKLLDASSTESFENTNPYVVNTAAMGGSNGALVIISGFSGAAGASTPKSGWTELDEIYDEENRYSVLHWRASSDTSATATFGSIPTALVGVGLEFEESGGGGGGFQSAWAIGSNVILYG